MVETNLAAIRLWESLGFHIVGTVPAAFRSRRHGLDIDLPGRTESAGIKRVNFDVVRLFVQPMPHQTSVLSRLMAHTQFDAIIVDAGFFGSCHSCSVTARPARRCWPTPPPR